MEVPRKRNWVLLPFLQCRYVPVIHIDPFDSFAIYNLSYYSNTSTVVDYKAHRSEPTGSTNRPFVVFRVSFPFADIPVLVFALNPNLLYLQSLAMTEAGSANKTREQMREALHLTGLKPEETPRAMRDLLGLLNPPRETDQPARLTIVNAIWGQKGFPVSPAYSDLIASNYYVQMQLLDFNKSAAATKTINDWVESKTEKKIKDLIPPGAIDGATRLVLTNAVYFKAAWVHPFREAATKDGKFTTLEGKSVTVPMMHQQERFGYAESASVQVLQMGYEGRDLQMVVLLPREAGGLPAMEKGLDAKALAGWVEKLKGEEVAVSLPRFKMTWGTKSLSEALKALGMTDAFSDKAADFSGMAKVAGEPLFITDVLHKAFVDVNEKGTEAAAATAVIMAAAAAPPVGPPKEFKADRPFLFVIRHVKSGAILFMGRVVNPAG